MHPLNATLQCAMKQARDQVREARKQCVLISLLRTDAFQAWAGPPAEEEEEPMPHVRRHLGGASRLPRHRPCSQPPPKKRAAVMIPLGYLSRLLMLEAGGCYAGVQALINLTTTLPL
jgi:hypothetical protein